LVIQAKNLWGIPSFIPVLGGKGGGGEGS